MLQLIMNSSRVHATTQLIHYWIGDFVTQTAFRIHTYLSQSQISLSIFIDNSLLNEAIDNEFYEKVDQILIYFRT